MALDWVEQLIARRNWLESLPDGEPCDHPGCLSHISHPCEVCGRVGGIRQKVYGELYALGEDGVDHKVGDVILTNITWPI
jgi:hypothetical protein